MAKKKESAQQLTPASQGLNRDGSRPVQPVKVSYTTSWLYFLMILCLLIAWYFPAKILVTRLLWPPAVQEGVRDSYTFVALAYEGVSRKENEVSPAQFAEHLQTLEDEGYVPISLEDVQRLMQFDEPVPRKAVLMTFDHGRRTSYFGTKSHLRRAGWKGVMFLWTKPIEAGDHSSLLWPYVRNMTRSRAWEIGAQSHNGFTPVQASASGRTGHYMTTPQWLEEEERFETPDEFAARVLADHEKTLSLIEDRTDRRPIAYAYPYGDFGQYQSRGTFMRRVNLAAVSQFYDLGFVSGNLPINTRHSDPRRLNRLRVRPDWSGEELVAYLEKAWPSESPEVAGTAEEVASSWIVDWGEMDLEDGQMSLRATETTTGAKMWLGGSDLAEDFYARVDFALHGGQLGLYVRASPDEESYVYLGVDAHGEAWLREKRAGVQQERTENEVGNELSLWLRQKHASLDRFTLASSQSRMEPRETHTLELFVRDQLLYALIDGNPMFGSHIKVRGEPKPGMFGISVWSPEAGRARVDISRIALRNQDPSIAAWADESIPSPYVIRWIHDNSYQLTQLSPPWITFSPIGQISRATWDRGLYDRLARIYDLELMPRVRIDEEEWLQRMPPNQLASQASELDLAGVFVNLASVQNPTASRIASWIQQATAALKERGMAMLVRLPTTLERPATINSILAISPGLQLVSASDSPLRMSARGRQLSTVQLAQIPPPESEEDLPIYYEIMALPDSPDDQTLQSRIVSLEQEGLAAFMAGDYIQAIEHWTEWQELDPSNPRPLMLIGDAHLRLEQQELAAGYYAESLELDPGQISLALRRARLLDEIGREEDAIEALNLYARLFPENAQVLLAQAEWLHRHDRSREARDMAGRVLHLDPYNLDALMLLIRLADTPEERRTYLERLVERAEQPANHFEMGEAIWEHDLLSIPEAHELGLLVDRIYRETTVDRVRTLYGTLRSRSSSVEEDLATGALSDTWWVVGGDTLATENHARLRADSTRTEVTARLLGSERMRDAFIEAAISDWTGSFWLYALRTDNQLVRFGFENPDRLHLQIWRDGRMIVNESKAVDALENNARLRLEMRGNGLMGLLDGRAVFDAPVPLPNDMWLGWLGLSSFDAQRGEAAVTLTHLRAGPLPLRLALLPAAPTEQEVDILLDGLRAHTRNITDVSPRWFTVRSDESWAEHMGNEERLFRLFSRYHRLRLMPVVDVMSGPVAPVRQLREKAEAHRLDGFLLRFDAMPSDEWFETMRGVLRGAGLDVLVIVVHPEREEVEVRPVGAAVDLFGGRDTVENLPWMSGSLVDQEFDRAIEALPADDPAVLSL